MMSMLKLTLINAVRRVYIPGCKHDSATVLQGSQGIKKSSFWQTLFGPFFSDALGDISSKDDLLSSSPFMGDGMVEIDGVTSRKHAGVNKSIFIKVNRPSYEFLTVKLLKNGQEEALS